jgi:UDP-N-acetylmuramoyl-L-alanyl-D-glutamate--2,6-diaminopimelate ligase
MSIKTTLEKLPFYNQAVLPYHWAQAVIASTKNGFPASKLRVIAVTGTNGKTTTCFMIWNMLRSAGYKTGLMTTVAYGIDKLKPELGHMTTVDAFTLNERIKKIADQGAEFLVLEVTSHAL